MGNYFISDIEDFKISYPDANLPEVKSRFKSLDEYYDIAKKIIKTLNINKKDAQDMLNSEDALSEIVRLLAMGDWRFSDKKGRTDYSYRNQCGIWAKDDYRSKFKTKANISRPSLDAIISSDEGENSLLSILDDKSVLEPDEIISSADKKEKIKKYVQFLMKNTKLTPVQRRCIELRFFEGIRSCDEIGRMMEPKISRQAVSQDLSKALLKLKQSALGTKK